MYNTAIIAFILLNQLSINNHLYAIALKLGRGIGPVFYKSLIDHFGSGEKVFGGVGDSSHMVFKKRGIGSALLSKREELLEAAQALLEKHQKEGVRLITYGDPSYSIRLAQLHAPPSLLYYKGVADLNHPRMVSIVGTRQPSAYGREVTKALVEQLKAYKVTIISGLAYGIDIIAHKAAIASKIPTIAVLPGGADKIYPPEHQGIFDQITDNQGAMVTEYSLGVQPATHHFPARNKIIAALSDATIVVEAPIKSGALITAYYANEFDREIFAIPGEIQSMHAAGCHELIKKHIAHLFTEIKDLAYVMNWSCDPSKKGSPLKDSSPPIALTAQEERFLEKLAHFSPQMVTTEALGIALDIPIEKVTSLALHLELKGVIEVIGDRYRRGY